ncbi:contact-dependent growth inhibition system immunity protein [Paenibacillus wenxiniae]|uniref:Contact-dependent growth inhibition system immunity protein n=1 Tax=Paenibacillus wenxiniae TaxID=1636843 RepID=A0ABW4RLC4_9BACL
MDTDYRDLSVSKISALLGIADDVPDERIPLSIWMEYIKNYKIKNLTDGNIAKLIRQEIFLEYIIPEALQRIQIDPLAGSLGDGELVEAFNYVALKLKHGKCRTANYAKM